MNAKTPIKAVILAAGDKSIRSDGTPLLLEDLGGKTVLAHVAAHVCQLLPPEDIAVIVGYRQEQVRNHLGSAYTYITQEVQKGTGHAVGLLAPWLTGFRGDLLILYGDTPLISPTSIRGMINRHRQTQACFSLLTAHAREVFPYGRIIRDADGHIVDIVEEAQLAGYHKGIREFNLGAYVVSVPEIFTVLSTMSPASPAGDYPFTDAIHALIHANKQIESYTIYDQDEIRGINTREDLEQANFVIQKRYFRRQNLDETGEIQFGTGGWRAVIGEGFTLFNVRRLCQALANEMIRNGRERQGVMIGFDRRFLSNRAAEAGAEIFAGNNIKTYLMKEDSPTPLIEFAADSCHTAYGLAFTASHNAPEWNGLKVFYGNGGFLMTEETTLVENEANRMSAADFVRIPLAAALSAGIVEYCDFTNAYVDRIESFVDLEAIRDAGMRVIVDPMYGVGHLTLGIILNDARCRVTFIHERHNPLFGGRSPAPDLNALRMLVAYVRDEQYHLGLAMDGDADRVAVINENGEYVQINDVLLLLYWYLHEVKGYRGGVVRNLATTHLLDRLAEQFGETCIETPVGFKWIANAMQTHRALLGGESSGGLTIRGHIHGKDGILASILIIEMMVKTGKTISALLEDVWALTGRMYTVEENLVATADMRVIVPARVKNLVAEGDLPYPVVGIREDDGTKLNLADGSWVLLRFSGTEPVLRIFAEAQTPEKAQELVTWLKQYAQ
ncbi:MAG: NTP transferase domain-containing protein [Anaerolineae bacterium]|nr:NTP transferase domain-containing protein [Anaerolineae bacterium]